MLIAVGIAGLAGAVQASEADIAAGEKTFQKVCKACHGPKGQGVSSYPKLAGKEADYLTDRLERYREGERFGPNSPLMIPFAKKLSDDDITDIVGYITTVLK